MLDVLIPIVIFTPITKILCFMLKFVVKMNVNLEQTNDGYFGRWSLCFLVEFRPRNSDKQVGSKSLKKFPPSRLEKKKTKDELDPWTMGHIHLSFWKNRQKASQTFKKQCLSSNRMIIILNSRGKLYKKR